MHQLLMVQPLSRRNGNVVLLRLQAPSGPVPIGHKKEAKWTQFLSITPTERIEWPFTRMSMVVKDKSINIPSVFVDDTMYTLNVMKYAIASYHVTLISRWWADRIVTNHYWWLHQSCGINDMIWNGMLLPALILSKDVQLSLNFVNNARPAWLSINVYCPGCAFKCNTKNGMSPTGLTSFD